MMPVMSTVNAITFIRRLFASFLNVTRNASAMCFKSKKNLTRDQYDLPRSLPIPDLIRLVSRTHQCAMPTLIAHSINAMVYTPVNPSLRYSMPDSPVPIGRHNAIVAFTKPTLSVFVFSCTDEKGFSHSYNTYYCYTPCLDPNFWKGWGGDNF